MYRKLTATALALGVSAVFAASAAATPSGGFSVFAQCPTGNPAVTACVYAKTESGHFVVGKKTVPITKTITLQGGDISGSGGEATFVAAANGETLSKTPQNVPGGLAGLVNCPEIGNLIERILCEATFENGLTGVTATTELAAPASAIRLNSRNMIFQRGVALVLPVKVHLENPLLGSECYVGSNSSPIALELTTGTTAPPPPNEPISGSRGEVSFSEEGRILTLHNNSLVNNSFAAPGASGCGGIFSFLIDPIIDSQLGVPSAAGHNTAVLTGTLETAGVEGVRGSETP
ncbi:MAG: hypothetical protein ACYCU0_06255 [Solirubrobacteraceae bacterium]